MWEPPILDYSEFIVDEHDKKRKAMLIDTGGDVARTTQIMDLSTELSLLGEYDQWVRQSTRSAVDTSIDDFFEELLFELITDVRSVEAEFKSFTGGGGAFYRGNEDGSYTVEDGLTNQRRLDLEHMRYKISNEVRRQFFAGLGSVHSRPLERRSHLLFAFCI